MKHLSSLATALERRLWTTHRLLLSLAMAVPIVLMWWSLWQPTPTRYPVSEFLINYADGFVRRGLGGQISLALHSFFGGPATIWAILLLSLAGASLCALILKIYSHTRPTQAMTPLILTPWGLLFITYDPDILIRKEVFGLIALALILLGALTLHPKRARALFLTACAALPLCALLHEANALLGGSFLCAAILFFRAHPQLKRITLLGSGLCALATLLATLAALRHPTADPAVICAAIPDPICTWPFPFMAGGAGSGFAYVQSYFTPAAWLNLAVVAAACSLPFFGLRPRNMRRAPLLGAAALIALPILPLFLIGIDYGRWIAMIALPASLIALTAIAQGTLSYTRILPPWAVLLYCGSWSFNHIAAALQWHALTLWIALALVCALQHLWPPRKTPM